MAVLGLDLDGVCGDYLAAMRLVASDRAGVPPEQLPDPKNWGLEGWFGDHAGFLSAHREAVHERRIFRSLPVIAGAVDAIRSLAAQGHQVRIVSNRILDRVGRSLVIGDTLEWLEQNGFVWHDIAFVTGDKSAVAADVNIDDSPSVIRAMVNAGRQVVVFEQPYNTQISHPPSLRARTWAEAEPKLRRLLDRADRTSAAAAA